LQESHGAICAIGDDDLLLPPQYLHGLWTIFEQQPGVSIAGGRVLPSWKTPAPAWLTSEHWAPVALTDYGAEPFYTDRERPICLLAAGFRKRDLLSVGQYDVRLSVSEGRVGGIEDSEIYNRMYMAGLRGYYDPSLSLFHKVEPERATKAYHRRWHFHRGRHVALTNELDEPPARFKLFGLPSYIYGMAVRHAWAWLRSTLRGNVSAAFKAESQLCFVAGCWWQRAVRRRNA
jgi:hypothetical protein